MRPLDPTSNTNSEGTTSAEVLGAIGLSHMCCRGVMVSTCDNGKTINKFSRPKIHEGV